MTFLFINQVSARETIYTDDIKIENINNNPNTFKIIVNWQNLPRREFEYYKISHSLTNSKITYPDWMIWYTSIIDDLKAVDNFSNYNPDLNWNPNYYRACIVTTSKLFCSKADYEVRFWVKSIMTNTQTINTTTNLQNISQNTNTLEIKKFLENNYEALYYIQKNDYLKNKIWIDVSNKEKLILALSNFSSDRLWTFKNNILIITRDISISRDIASWINDLSKIEEKINSSKWSISVLWEYTLNKNNLTKLEALKKEIEEKGLKAKEEENQKVVNDKISSIMTKSSDLLSSIDLDYSSKVSSEIEYMRSWGMQVSDQVWLSFWLSKSSDLSETLGKLQEMKREIKDKMSENKEAMTSTWLTQNDKYKIKQENDKLQSSMDQIDELVKQINELEKEKTNIIYNNIKLSLLVIFLIFVIILVILFKLKNRKIIIENKNITNHKILQIIKNWNEYSVEFEWTYNKWIKVLESTKNSIKNWVENFVRASNIMNKTRWFLDDLEKINIEIPDLWASWNTIFKLFLNDEIKEKLLKQEEWLIIKTDEQEIPWEIMHNWQTFLSLKLPISRQIMTREKIKQTKVTKNKTPKMLFIVNPTNDLKETEVEVENIVKKISSKAEIKILKWNNANLINVIWELSKDNYDIIHYSGHSYFDNEKPDEWGLILANKEILSNTEIKRLLEWNPLIFLNACSSGKSLSDNEEFYKNTWEDTIWLATSFYIGWAKWVISALWPINDEKASLFATNFYLKFLSHDSIWNAILNAKKETYMQNPKDPTWASFIYYWDLDFKINLK